jgi:hypothetical protein
MNQAFRREDEEATGGKKDPAHLTVAALISLLQHSHPLLRASLSDFCTHAVIQSSSLLRCDVSRLKTSGKRIENGSRDAL